MRELIDPEQALHELINGYQVSQAIHVGACLRLADHLADGPKTSGDLAVMTDTDASALYRLLRALAAAGVLREAEDRMFSLTPVGQYLRTDIAGSRQAWAAFIGRPAVWEAWGHLLHSVRSGQNAFLHVHGMDVWGYRASNTEEGTIFDSAMREGSVRTFKALAAAYDFGQFNRIVDVGGGNGSFLAGILAANPSTSGVLFDQTHVIAGARKVLELAGVVSQCEVIGGSFFDRVPPGADAYILKFILHDWTDEQAVAILRTCRRAMTRDGKLLVIERVVAPPNEGLEGKLSDLNMLVNAGGRERTEGEFAALLDSAGFQLRSVSTLVGHPAVIEATPRD